MPHCLESAFSRRVEQFFRLRAIHIDKDQSQHFMAFLYNEFTLQNRFNTSNGRFYITPRFMYDALSKFLKISPVHCLELFRTHSMRRHLPPYPVSHSHRAPAQKSSRGLIDLVGRQHAMYYKVTKADGSVLSPSKVARVKRELSSYKVGFSPFAAVNPANKVPRQRAVASDSTQFEQDMVSADSDMALWRQQTPHKNMFFSPHRLRTQKDLASSAVPRSLSQVMSSVYDAPAKKNTIERFDFVVTKNDIEARINAKRPVSQKQVMSNFSAFEVMKELGVLLSEKQTGRNFHWAHRQGWSLQGSQSKSNLDPMTAGSNYDTLFKVEAPLKRLLMDGVADEIAVRGEVVFDGDIGLPFKITYRLSWGSGSVEIVIDPMSQRVPAVEEHEVANLFMRF